MKHQRSNLLTVLGCSGSAALILSFGSPTTATPMELQGSELHVNPVVQSDTNPIEDALGCGCTTCQMSQIQSF